MTIQVIPSRERDLGDGFMVRRLLPTKGRKMVGAFIFFDHMGPAIFRPNEGLDVRPHLHINLATVTYLFEGEIMHRDSLGSAQIIRPGDINWMTAGRGIVHSERTPPATRRSGSRLAGIQCWVALPREYEEVQPTFVHHPEGSIPSLDLDGLEVRVLVGAAFGVKSPVHSFSDILYLDIKMPMGSRLEIPADRRELAAYSAQGILRTNGQEIAANSLAISSTDQDLTLEASSAACVMVIGGRPFLEQREIWWNFVSSSKERIEMAKADWAAGRFPQVPGDDKEFIPLPSEPLSPRKPEGTIM